MAHLGGLGSRRRHARTDRAEARERLRARRRLLEEDVVALAVAVRGLPRHSLDAAFDEPLLRLRRAAVRSSERAEETFLADDLDATGAALEDGRYQLACVAALAVGRPAPLRLPECWFDPGHGPSVTRAAWAPTTGADALVERLVPVCAADATLLDGGRAPAVRLVQVGAREVPLFGMRRGA